MIGTQLLPADGEYHTAILSSVTHAKERILLETMDFDTVEHMKPIIDACMAARLRGVSVTIIYDIHSYSNAVREHGRAGRAELQRWQGEAVKAGITIQTVGAKEINPFAGRHHAKAAIIDTHCYIGGGVNLTSSSFETRDFMQRCDDPELADVLYTSLPLFAIQRTEDCVMYRTSTMEVLLDAGIRGRSVIYDHVYTLAQQATKIWYVSKLAPDGPLAQIMRTKDTQYWFNSLSSAISFDKLAILIDRIKFRLPNSYRGGAMLHAKFCVFELPDGRLEAISGSHNFNSRGVRFGTQELAIHTKDQGLCRQLITFAESL